MTLRIAYAVERLLWGQYRRALLRDFRGNDDNYPVLSSDTLALAAGWRVAYGQREDIRGLAGDRRRKNRTCR